MWELVHKEGWAPKNWCFQIMVLEKTFQSPLNCKESKVLKEILKEIKPEYSLEGLMLKLKLQYFGHLMWGTDSLEKTLMLGTIEKVATEDGMVGWHHQLNGHESAKTLGDNQGQRTWCAAIHEAAMSWTGLSEQTTAKWDLISPLNFLGLGKIS